MFANGIDIGAAFRHPLLAILNGVGFVAWLVAFAAMCASEADYNRHKPKAGQNVIVSSGPVVGDLWFAIWVQLAVVVGFFLACIGDTLPRHRFQICLLLAIAIVFAASGTNMIYQAAGALKATGAGWLISLIVDILMLLFLSSDESSSIYHAVTFAQELPLTTWGESGFGGGRNRSLRRPHHTEAGMYASESTGLRNGAAERGMSVNDSPMGNGYPLTHTMNSGMNGINNGMSSPIGAGYAATKPQTDSAEQTVGSIKPSGTVASRDDFSAVGQSVDNVSYQHRAKANYAYQASPDDPNEVSFAKNDILDVLDATGKWFQVRTPSGQTGIAPSNYLTLM